MSPLVLFLFALVISTPSVVYAEDESDVLELTSETFNTAISDNKIILVDFYAEWCGHCQKLAPTYEKVATTLKEESIPVARIDGAKNEEVSIAQKIQGFPTVRLYVNGRGIEYEGTRTLEDLLDFVKKASKPPLVALKTKEEVDSFIAENPVSVIGCFGDPELESMELRDAFFDVASGMFVNNKMAFASVDIDPTLSGASECPSIVVRHPDYESLLEYKFGDPSDDSSAFLRNAESVKRWVTTVTIPVLDEINGFNFQRYIDAGLPIAWLIGDPKDEAFNAVKPWMTKIAKEYVGQLLFVWLDDTVFHSQSKLLGVGQQNLPSFVISVGRSKFGISDELAGKLTEEPIREWVAEFIAGNIKPQTRSQPIPDPEENSKKFVKDIVADNFENVTMDSTKDVFVKFYAPWCGHSQALAPIYDELGKVLSSVDSLLIAQVDATENDFPDKVQIPGYPTLILFPANSSEMISYEGDRSVVDFIRFLQEHASVSFELPEAAKEAIKAAEEEDEEEEEVEIKDPQIKHEL